MALYLNYTHFSSDCSYFVRTFSVELHFRSIPVLLICLLLTDAGPSVITGGSNLAIAVVSRDQHPEVDVSTNIDLILTDDTHFLLWYDLKLCLSGTLQELSIFLDTQLITDGVLGAGEAHTETIIPLQWMLVDDYVWQAGEQKKIVSMVSSNKCSSNYIIMEKILLSYD